MNTKVTIGKLKLKNPVMTASGTFGYGAEFAEFVNLNDLGAVVMKGISVEPRDGNPPPRIHETACGMLNAIGLQNVGLKKFIKDKLRYIKNKKYNTNVVANILGNTPDEYIKLASELDGAGVDAIELNVSCPNVDKGGIEFCADPNMLGRLVKQVRKVVKSSTLIVKLSPSATDIRVPARVCEEEGADAISLINSIPGMAIDIATRRPLLSNVIGGLSGPAIKPVAVRMVWQASKAVKIPIIGMGGIQNASDAIEFMLAGATAVAVGTANFINPRATAEIVEGIVKYMRENNIKNISEIIGGLVTDDNPDD
jgi:dihydroorotate dehydrogenase (NAD+) catalytic subunit